MFRLDPQYLQVLAAQHRAAYGQASPFPHVVIDNFLPETMLASVLDEFPRPETIEWQHFDNAAEKKLANRLERHMGDATLQLLYQLNSAVFIEFLEALTGITGLIPDPYFVGGGLHQIERGGFLKVHADFNWHDKLHLHRRLNFLLYLNRDWREEYGGHLELWDTEMRRCEQRILPIFNRCVVFSTTDVSYHGHPDPLTCPAGQTRKSLALFYYTSGGPTDTVASRSTVFQARPGEQMTFAAPRLSARQVVKKLTPPILIDLYRSLRKTSTQ